MRSVSIPFTTKVVGISQYQAVAAKVETGDSVEIRREPENPYDANACVILYNGSVLGYVPKVIAARLAKRDEGSWTGVVVARHDAKATIGIEVRVEHAHASSEMVPMAIQQSSKACITAVERLVAAKRSGRILGTLVRVERDLRRVIVSTDAGDVPYPDGLVDIVETGR